MNRTAPAIPTMYKALIFVSLAMNVLLVFSMVFLLAQLMTLRSDANALITSLHDNLQVIETSQVSSDVTVSEPITVDAVLPIDQETNVILQEAVPLTAETTVTLPIGGSVTAPVDVELPEGLALPIRIQADLPLNQDVPLNVTIPVSLAMAETELATPLRNMREALAPYIE